MSAMFGQSMTALDEVEAYLAGAREGYKVHVPTSSDETAATSAADGDTQCEMASVRSE